MVAPAHQTRVPKSAAHNRTAAAANEVIKFVSHAQKIALRKNCNFAAMQQQQKGADRQAGVFSFRIFNARLIFK